MPIISPGIKRWVIIDASPEVAFDYLTDLSNHGEWDGSSGFVVVRFTQGPVVKGSHCQRERPETFQAPLLRGGKMHNEVIWTKRLTVVECEPNNILEFETQNLYNGISIGSESISFRLFLEGSKTILVMTDKKNPHLPGIFHVLVKVTESIKSWIARPIVSVVFSLFPCLRVNSQLKRIKYSVERA